MILRRYFKPLVFGAIAVMIPVVSVDARRSSRSSSGMESLENAIDSALVLAPKDGEVCFSPDEACGAKIVKFMASARKSLDIAIYDINLDELVHALLQQSRKIPVRLVVDRKQAKGAHSAVSLLAKAGIPLKYGRQRGIMHNKFIIVDGARLETGSFNQTHHAAFANNENQIYLADPAIVKRFQERFEKLWREGDPHE